MTFAQYANDVLRSLVTATGFTDWLMIEELNLLAPRCGYRSEFGNVRRIIC